MLPAIIKTIGLFLNTSFKDDINANFYNLQQKDVEISDRVDYFIEQTALDPNKDPEVTSMRISEVKSKTFEPAGLRLEEIEQDHKTHLADTMPYKGKQIGLYADSIGAAQSPTGFYTNTWLKRVGSITGAIITNNAIGGSTMAVGFGYGWDAEDTTNAFCNRIDTANLSSYNYLLINYGTNDYGFVIEMGKDTDAVKTTFKGALNYSLNKLTTDYPNLKIIMLTPMYAPTSLTKNAKGYTMTDYVEAIKTIANKYNIPVIDLHKGMGINENNYTDLYWDNLHPLEATHTKIGDYVAQSMGGISAVGEATVKANLPVIGGYNLIKYGDFNPNGTFGKFDNVIREKGFTFSILPNVTKASNAFLKVIPSETLYLTYWCKSLADNQYYEVDLFSGSKLVTSAQYAKTGEELITAKFEIPAGANPATDYQLRFTSDAGNISALDFSSLMLTRSNVPMLWSPAPGEETEMWFKSITVTAPTANGNPTPSYRKNGNSNVELRGWVVVAAGSGIVCTLPVEARPSYTIIRAIVSPIDGTIAYCNISAAGVLSVSVLGKTYDLSSIVPYFAGAPDVR